MKIPANSLAHALTRQHSWPSRAGVAAKVFILVAALWAQSLAALAQTVYGVGAAGATGTTYNRLFSIAPTTGATTDLCGLSYQSAAAAVSPVTGRVHYFEYNVANARMNTINPANCTNGTPIVTTLPASVIRASFCPDGRLYASTNSAQFYELSPTTGAVIRTLNYSGIPTSGSGDLVCVNNGDFYVVANTTSGSAGYSLFKTTALAVSTAANNSNVAFATVGPLNLAGSPNGLAEISANISSCAAAPAPCLLASTGTSNRIWGIDTLTGDADQLAGVVPHVLTDLSRSFPLDISISQTSTPSIVLQGQTITYVLTITNAGPAVAGAVTVTDVFPTATFASVQWTCSVVTAGSSTAVATACGSASGSGSIITTASLSIGGVIQYTANARLTDTFTGVVSNTASATISAALTELASGNNTTNPTTNTVVAAAKLEIFKTNNVSSVFSGASTTYTISVVNSGPANAPGTTVRDPVVPQLSCSTLSCSTSGTASCPSPLSLTALQSTGLTITPTFNTNSTVTFTLGCTVAATGS